MGWARRILLIALVAALVVGVGLFVTRNSEPIAIDYLFGRVEAVAIWVALLGAFSAGMLVAALLGILSGARLRLEAMRYRKAARDLESEVHQLRNLPLSTGDDEPGPARDELSVVGGVERGT
jgi:uncharacterized integral membrane protein